jgi:anti-anti-sigma factor
MEHNAISSGDSLELALTGKFTFADNQIFNNLLDEMAQYKKIIIDLGGVEFIDSAALGILLLVRDKCDKTATNLKLKNPKGQVKQMFDISRFGDLFNIEHS